MAVTWTLMHVSSAVTRELGGDPLDTSSSGGWGFEIARRRRSSFRADTLELQVVPDAFDEDAPGTHNPGNWSNGDQVEVFRAVDGGEPVRYFAGRLSGERRSADSIEQSLAWNVVSPWQDLEELQYFQTWGTRRTDPDNEGGQLSALVERGDVVLMQRYTGSGSAVAIKTGEQVFDLLEFAAFRTGATPTFQFPGGPGNPDSWLFTGINVDFVQARDETVANLIRRLMEWHPRAVSWFDYTTTPPTLHISETDFDTVEIDRTDLDQTGIDISPNDELNPPYVKISYKRVNQVDAASGSNSYVDVVEDVFPLGADTSSTDHRKALRATVDLEGSRASIQEQRVRTRTIPESFDESNIDPDSEEPFEFGTAWKEKVLKFWANDDRIGWLADLIPPGDELIDHLDVAARDGHLVVQPEILDLEAFPGGDPDPTYELWETPRALDRGSTVQGWMNVKSQRVKCSCRITFKGPAKNSKTVAQLFQKNDAITGLPLLEASTTVTATDAVSKTYSRVTSQTAAEDVPQGIAEKLYDDLSILKHTGRVRIEADDVGATVTNTDGDEVDLRPGLLINITNSNHSGWATIEAQVQEVVEGIEVGGTDIIVGAPEQLGLQNFVALARLWSRNPPGYTTQDERETGKVPGIGKNTGGEHNAKENPVIVPADRDPFLVSLDGLATDPNVELFVEPGEVLVDREDDGITRRDPIVPKFIGGERLDADPRPSFTFQNGDRKEMVFAHKFDDQGNVEDVEIQFAAQVPQDDDDGQGTEYRHIATVDTNENPPVVEQHVQGNYYWPRKKEPVVPGGGVDYIPPFHPIITNGNNVKFQPGVAVGELIELPIVADAGPEDPPEMWHEFTPFVGNKRIDDPNPNTLPFDANLVTGYYMRVTYTVITCEGGEEWNSTNNVKVEFYRVLDDENITIVKSFEPVPGEHPQDNIAIKYIPLAKIDDRVNPPLITSVWHGGVDIRRPPVLKIDPPSP